MSKYYNCNALLFLIKIPNSSSAGLLSNSKELFMEYKYTDLYTI